MSKQITQKDPEKVFNVVSDLLRCSDFVANSLRYWDETLLRDVFNVALHKIDNFEKFLSWLTFLAKQALEGEFMKQLFQKEFACLTEKYSIHELFNGMTASWRCGGSVFKDDDWCGYILKEYEHRFQAYDDFIAGGDFALLCCKKKQKARDLYKKAEVLARTFDEVLGLANRVLNDLHDDAWGFGLLLKGTEMIENNHDAGRVMSLAYSFTENQDNEPLYCRIQSKAFQWKEECSL